MQGSLFEFEPLPVADDKLFFALVPDADLTTRIVASAEVIRAEYGVHSRIRRDHFHLTLNALEPQAGVQAELLDRVRQAVATIHFSAFEIRFDRAMSFVSTGEKAPLVLASSQAPAALTTLQQELAKALLLQRLPLSKQPFSPHLTLLYDPIRISTVDIEPISWSVAELVLIHGRTGELYRILERRSAAA
ncbi:MAG: 2,5 ligase [Verrucomicrobiaceae bacterium]|nr:2,5 ligase [Verrucomicrobiaceae bacterium]